MAEDSEQQSQNDKPFDPTPNRLARAQREGDVVRSRDVQTLAVPVALLLGGLFGSAALVKDWGNVLLPFLAQPDLLFSANHGKSLSHLILEALSRSFLVLWPLWGGMLVLVFLSVRVQGALTWNIEKLNFNWQRISIFHGVKQKFGWSALLDFAKNILAVAVSVLVLWIALQPARDAAPAMIQLQMGQIVLLLANTAFRLLCGLVFVTGIMAGLDYLRQYWFFMRRMRLSYQELKEELRENEGDPHFKGERRKRANEIAMNTMLAEVPKADVVITNPTHYAVALYWSRTTGSAPIVVAKGADDIAAIIRDIATEHHIPMLSNPPLARQLYADVDLNEEIPQKTYRAVAAAIRFAQDVREKRKKRGF